MLRFLADQNFDGDIVRGLLRSIPDLDVVTAHQANLSEAPDPDMLIRSHVQGIKMHFAEAAGIASAMPKVGDK